MVGERPLVDVVRDVLEGGADVVQLRDKEGSPQEVAARARELLEWVHQAGALLLVNDHWEVAREVGADGVHVGGDDASVATIRAACGPGFRIGASARDPEVAVRLEAEGADYLGVGPVFGTSTKDDAPAAIGPERLSAVVRVVRIPVIGIGGVGISNAGEVLRAGARGVAVVSSVMGAPDPRAATRALRAELDLAQRLAGIRPGC